MNENEMSQLDAELEQAVNERIIVKSYDKVGHVIYTPAPF
jgi:hypothetical protein